MVKAEWGSKRTCPKCATRFYDLGKDNPVTCIECGVSWEPEPVLKSKQPLPYDAPKKEREAEVADDADLAADDLEIDEDAEENPDDEVDLGGDDDIGVTKSSDEDEEI
ncbi:TIGR02300 family protein [Allosphingosinicella vermicomposti]|uniref:TIGR02300 family protein n=1 Tax=Allosphingosinicella vermicomposti TaxID=614671 RepID=UPI000D0F8BD7|nr:TIGR02300 family protein [Allosphingosinicella vermicomposti]